MADLGPTGYGRLAALAVGGRRCLAGAEGAAAIRVPENREEWAMHLRARGIGTAVHYPLPTHQQPLYEEEIDKSKFPGAPGTTNARCMTGDVSLPVTELAAKQVLSLPVHPALSGEDLSTIAREVRALCN